MKFCLTRPGSSVGRAEDWKSSCRWFNSTPGHQTSCFIRSFNYTPSLQSFTQSSRSFICHILIQYTASLTQLSVCLESDNTTENTKQTHCYKEECYCEEAEAFEWNAYNSTNQWQNHLRWQCCLISTRKQQTLAMSNTQKHRNLDWLQHKADRLKESKEGSRGTIQRYQVSVSYTHLTLPTKRIV